MFVGLSKFALDLAGGLIQIQWTCLAGIQMYENLRIRIAQDFLQRFCDGIDYNCRVNTRLCPNVTEPPVESPTTTGFYPLPEIPGIDEGECRIHHFIRRTFVKIHRKFKKFKEKTTKQTNLLEMFLSVISYLFQMTRLVYLGPRCLQPIS